jgi:aspartyl-tRNA(Asn)/glutamyl-tRNA(Gln) amidotransferase subunit A
MDHNVIDQSALTLGQQIEAGACDPRALVEQLLQAIPAADPDRVIYSRLCPERARAEAEAAYDRAKRGLRRSLLDGVPLSWKDLFDTAGIETCGGSALLAGRIPMRDALVLERLRTAGTICIGKTNMTELAFSGLGINPVTGTPANPYDPVTLRAPGGSTSGGAVSVARGLAAAAIGSDTGGSIRLPAAWNGLVGLKPTWGAMPMTGVLPLAASFDTIGPLAQDVADAAALFDLMSARPHRPITPASLSRCVFWQPSEPVAAQTDEKVAFAFQSALKRLTATGARVVEGPWPEAVAALALGPIMVGVEAFAQWGAAIDAAPQRMSEQLRSRFGGGRHVTASAYLQAQTELVDIKRAHAHAYSGFDALILPTCAIVPPPIQPLLDDPDLFSRTNLLALRNTRLANLLGLPALTLPLADRLDGLPVGLMLVGLPQSEARLLALGAALERILVH